MKGKTRGELVEIGKKTRFSKANQPDNRGPKKKLPALDILLADVLGSEDENGDKSEARAILQAMIKEAKGGNVQAGIAVLNRAYGMPKQALDIGGQKDNPLRLQNVSDADLDRALNILEGNGE